VQKWLNQDEKQQVIASGVLDTVIHADKHRNVI
jgi:hypothetical protein